MTTIEQISDHLQFLGYEVTSDDRATKAIHSEKWNLFIKPLKGGVLFTSFLTGNNYAKNKKNKQAYLEFINSTNQVSSVTRFYADNDFDLVMEAVWPGDYSKIGFGEFIEQWDADTRIRLLQSGANKFLE